MTSFGHSKPCQKTMYIYASLSLIISLIKLMSINYAYNNKKNLTWIFMKGAGCYSEFALSILNDGVSRFIQTKSGNHVIYVMLVGCQNITAKKSESTRRTIFNRDSTLQLIVQISSGNVNSSVKARAKSHGHTQVLIELPRGRHLGSDA